MTDDPVAAELLLLTVAVRRDRGQVEELLEPEFREVGASGRVWGRAEIVEALTLEQADEDIRAHDVRTRQLSSDLVLVTYVSQQPSGRRAYRTSLWRRTDGTWRLLHHQGTPLA